MSQVDKKKEGRFDRSATLISSSNRFDDPISRLSEALFAETNPRLVKQYQQLPKLAHELDFGVLDEDIVILDAEMTGLSWTNDRLIQVSAARVRNKSVVERFETFINPGRPIPSSITKLTGISDADVKNAPNPHGAMRELADFVAGQSMKNHPLVI